MASDRTTETVNAELLKVSRQPVTANQMVLRGLLERELAHRVYADLYIETHPEVVQEDLAAADRLAAYIAQERES